VPNLNARAFTAAAPGLPVSTTFQLRGWLYVAAIMAPSAAKWSVRWCGIITVNLGNPSGSVAIQEKLHSDAFGVCNSWLRGPAGIAKHCLRRTLSASTSAFSSSDEFSRMTIPHASKKIWTTKRASRVTLRVRCARCLRRNCDR